MLSAELPVFIPLNKKKLILLLAGALLLFIIGVWMVSGNHSSENSYWNNSAKRLIAGYAAIFFFGLVIIAITRKLRDKTPGLVIDHLGINDNASGISAGYIPWSDIDNISTFEIRGQKFIMIQVKNPEFYIERQTSMLTRKAMAMNNRLYGTPVCLSSNALSVNFSDLFILIYSNFQAKQVVSHNRK